MENGKQTQLSGDLNINYNHAFGKHHLFGNAGYFISETKYQAYQHQAEGFGNESAADITFAHQYAENTLLPFSSTTDNILPKLSLND